jgi:hypothetical protein
MASDKRRIFLASSEELRTDRDAFRLFVGDLNKRWHDRGLFLEVTVWEDFDDAMSPTRKQDDYNEALRQCDLFVMLYWTKVGKYTGEEFEAAHTQFKATERPLIYTYGKSAPIPTGAVNRRDMNSLLDFKDRLEALAHFPTPYDSVAALTGHFRGQLEDLVAKGFFGEKAKGGLGAGAPAVSVSIHGGGAAAVGDHAQAVGQGGVILNGDNHGSVHTGQRIDTGGGASISGNVTITNGSFVGRDQLGRPDQTP